MTRPKIPSLPVCWAAIGVMLAVALAAHAAAAQDRAQIEALTNAYSASGLELLRQLAGSPGNIVLSPYSVGTAMAMVRSGARGDTEAQMASVLKHRLSRPETEAANANVLAILKGYDRSAEAPSCPAGMRLSGRQCEREPSAGGYCPVSMRREGEKCVGGATFPSSARLLIGNALMLTTWGDLVSNDYAALVAAAYAAEVFRGAGLDEINGWVARQTEGKIDKILDRLNRDSLAVVLNAVYFRSRWASTFDDKRTREDTFNLSRSHKIQIPMMLQTANFPLVARQGYRAVRLPYEVRALGMIIVLPDEVDGLAAIGGRMDAKELSELIDRLRERQADKVVALAVPRFKAEFKADLVPQFRKAGMTRPFEAQAADFSGITGQPPAKVPVAISQIMHRALIEVAEETTEAAAATAIELVAPTAAPRPAPSPEVFRVDRPFLFYIVDEATGALLFEGRITNPRARS